MQTTDLHKIEESAAFLRARGYDACSRLILLGTGFRAFTQSLEGCDRITFEKIPHFPPATMEEHGYLCKGTLSGKPVIALQGRHHYYEGYSASEIIFPLRVFKLLGLKELILTNTAQLLKPEYSKTRLALIKDHINLIPDNPLRGYNIDSLGPRFPDLDKLYSESWRREIQEGLRQETKPPLPELTYLAYSGPSKPTPAEREFYRMAGADIIGMSTCPEAIAAAHMDIKVLGVSVLESSKKGLLNPKGDEELAEFLRKIY